MAITAEWLKEPDCPGVWVRCHICTDAECGEPHVCVEEVVVLPDDFDDFDWEEWTPGSLWTKAPLQINQEAT